MARGDHVFVRRGRRYSHHGIDCGDGTVIHYAGGWRVGLQVERTSMTSFAAGGEVLVRAHRSRLPADEILARAQSRLGSTDYHLVRNNCEHLATWASTGSSGSRQVRGWALLAPGALASLGVVTSVGTPAVLFGGLGMGAVAAASPWFRRRRRYARDLEAPLVGTPELAG